MCRQIRELADSYGARTVAEGVETRADFLVVRELGFDLIQGFLLGKPMTMRKFARAMMRQTIKLPE
jgi:EAL domain-containing protein (putative c-di-GMP-specific phosphodiesterase class I)